MKKTKQLSLIITFLSLSFMGNIGHAQDAALAKCMKTYLDLKVSPDMALSECRKMSMIDCVKSLAGTPYVAFSIKEEDGKFLVDVGNETSRWMEGKTWDQISCSAFQKGPYRRQSDKYAGMFGSGERSYEWFRQAWCTKSQVQLEQPYSLEEAKLRCELGVEIAPKPAAPKPN